jgi:peptide-methionine (S)-S-oxide reductase
MTVELVRTVPYSNITYSLAKSEYRSAIFTHSPGQFEIAQQVTKEIQQKHFDPKGAKIVTKVVEAGQWWDAEDYHQLYLFKNPRGYQCSTHRLHW